MNITTKLNRAEDDQVDNDYDVSVDGKLTPYSIQHCPYMNRNQEYCVNYWDDANGVMYEVGYAAALAGAVKIIEKDIKGKI